MTNSEDPDQTAPQTAPQGESDQSLHCFEVLSVLILRILRYTAL